MLFDVYCHDIASPVVRCKKHRKTTSAVEDEERARRLEAKQSAYEQKCAQNEHGEYRVVLLPRPLRYYGYQKQFSRPRAGMQRALRRRHKRPR